MSRSLYTQIPSRNCFSYSPTLLAVIEQWRKGYPEGMGSTFETGICVSQVAPVGMGNTRSLDDRISWDLPVNGDLYS
jgi:hypothetical protein